MAYDTEWSEDLPPECHPDDAHQPDNVSLYRLVGNIPPQHEDFWSQRRLFPQKRFNVSECVVKACSLIATVEHCSALTKLPAQQGKKVIKIVLPPHSGLIKQTGRNEHHFSWWWAKNFDPIPACTEVDV